MGPCSWVSRPSVPLQTGARVRTVGTQGPVYGLPPLNDHIFEWHDLIAAIECSTGQFIMLELGAGWAKWIVDATKITRVLNRTSRAIGIEA